MDKLEFTARFEVKKTFGSRAIAIFRERRMFAPPLALIRINGHCFYYHLWGRITKNTGSIL